MDKEDMAKLKTAMLEAATAAHLAAIILDYTHQEIMIVFQELEAEQQNRIKTVWKTVS
ncbi:hypothetical protein [Microcoleus sp. S13_B4]|uniref:hypothetical protein n=1 Tax=Microcoleus sp. S13_B4 TaxID=3055408 RepID=UPI002FD2777A